MSDTTKALQVPSVTKETQKAQDPSNASDVSTPETDKEPETPEAIAKKMFSESTINWAEVYNTIQTNQKVRQIVAGNQEYLNKILDCNVASSKQLINDILDNLVEIVNDEAILSKFITKRFGVDLSPGSYNPNNTINFEQNGLKASYQVLKRLPPSHVKRLLSLTTNNTSGGSSGVTRNSERINISYNKNDIGKTENGAYADKGDTMYGMVMFDTTLAHEMGHVADLKHRYSRDNKFLKIAGWKEYTSPKQIVKTIVSNMEDPLPSSLDSTDKKVAKAAAETIVEDQNTNDSEYDDIIKQTYQDKGYSPTIGEFISGLFTSKEDKKKKEEEKAQGIPKKIQTIKQSTLFKHINIAFASKSPWMHECFSYLPKIQIHQGYTNSSWWSYKNKARTDITKNSRYQFRDPGEDFAELYATYYMGDESKRNEIEPKRKDWFEKTVVKDAAKGK